MKPDCVILGGGVAGLSSAWHLARAGARVLLLEAEAQLGIHSSAQNASILRTTMYQVDLMRLAQNASKSLHCPPPGFCDSPLVHTVGLLLTGSDLDTFEANLAHHAPAPIDACRGEVVDANWIAANAPYFSHPDGAAGKGLWFPGEGHIDIALLVDSFAKGARAFGAELRLGAVVTEVLTAPDGRVTGVLLQSGERIETDNVLLAGGAWASDLGRTAGAHLDLFPRRRHLFVTAPEPGTGPTIDPKGPVVWHQDTERAFYMRPESGGMLLCPCDETLLDPDSPFPTGACPKDEDALEAVALAAARFAPTLANAGLAAWWSGWRTFTEHGLFALGPDAHVPGLHWCAGLAGHGMTTSFESGRLAAKGVADALGLGDSEVLQGDDYGGAFRPAPSAAVSNG